MKRHPYNTIILVCLAFFLLSLGHLNAQSNPDINWLSLYQASTWMYRTQELMAFQTPGLSSYIQFGYAPLQQISHPLNTIFYQNQSIWNPLHQWNIFQNSVYPVPGLGPLMWNIMPQLPSTMTSWGYGFGPMAFHFMWGATPQSKPPQQPPPVEQNPQLQTEPILLSTVQQENTRFLKHYALSALNIPLNVPEYDLPLNFGEICNFADFTSKIPLNQKALDLLAKNGFVIIDNPFNAYEEDITIPYKELKDSEVPVFITSDSLLHLYHIQFDETLRQIEEREFYDKIWDINAALLEDSIEKYENTTGALREASKRNVAYLSVGLRLLQPRQDQLCDLGSGCKNSGLASAFFKEEDLLKYHFEVPAFVSSTVNHEISLIEAHEGFAASPIFVCQEDYSQYVPRGHYTRSEKLKNYFKAMMWYGRISMLLKGTDDIPPGFTDHFHPEALISTYDAMIQTMQACLIAAEFAKNQDVRENWDRIYSVTAFYVGLSDDLGPYEYIEAMDAVFDGEFTLDDLTEANIQAIKAKLAEYMPPQIFGGTGNCGIIPPFTSEQADECLEKTKGFRLMGQGFIPDSYMFSNLVGAYMGDYVGERHWSDVFTCVISDAGLLIRGFPRGLDVMALLGSQRAGELLAEMKDDQYEDYAIKFQKLKDEFSEFDETDWNQNLYWAWLFALKSLLKGYGSGYPTFMQTMAWQDKALTTALASWTELRHDTILYAKQSYTGDYMSGPPPEKPVVGYIEPIPEFFNRLVALTRMTTKGLDEMAVLDHQSRVRLQGLETILNKLTDLAKKELMNQALTQADYDYIKYFGEILNGVIEEVNDKAKKTTIVADVHTDANTGRVLEEGVGYVKMMVAAYRVPDGRIIMGAGPVMSYYEFKQPMNDRLTDEAWRDRLKTDPPDEPEWIGNFAE